MLLLLFMIMTMLLLLLLLLLMVIGPAHALRHCPVNGARRSLKRGGDL